MQVSYNGNCCIILDLEKFGGRVGSKVGSYSEDYSTELGLYESSLDSSMYLFSYH